MLKKVKIEEFDYSFPKEYTYQSTITLVFEKRINIRALEIFKDILASKLKLQDILVSYKVNLDNFMIYLHLFNDSTIPVSILMNDYKPYISNFFRDTEDSIFIILDSDLKEVIETNNSFKVYNKDRVYIKQDIDKYISFERDTWLGRSSNWYNLYTKKVLTDYHFFLLNTIPGVCKTQRNEHDKYNIMIRKAKLFSDKEFESSVVEYILKYLV